MGKRDVTEELRIAGQAVLFVVSLALSACSSTGIQVPDSSAPRAIHSFGRGMPGGLQAMFRNWGIHPRTTLQAMGFDPGLHIQCDRTVNESTAPGDANFYFDGTNCAGGTAPSSLYWLTGDEVETLASHPDSCIGGPTYNDQSYVIGQSPVTEVWKGSEAFGYSVAMQVDYAGVQNPCGGSATTPTWTWVPFMDNMSGGSVLPSPTDLEYTATEKLAYPTFFSDKASGNVSALRAFIGMSGAWTDAAHGYEDQIAIEINTYESPALNYKIIPPEPCGIVNYSASPDPTTGGEDYYVNVDGSTLSPSIVLPRNAATALTVQWYPVIQYLQSIPGPCHWAKAMPNYYIPSAVPGTLATWAAWTGMEARDQASGTAGPNATLTVSGIYEYNL